MAEASRAGRIAQLQAGVRGAAAALPEAQAGLADRAATAADRLRAAARRATTALAGDEEGGPAARLGPGVEPGQVEAALGTALERLEALHYALLRVAVLEEEVELEPAAAAVEEEAARIAGLLEGEDSDRAGA